MIRRFVLPRHDRGRFASIGDEARHGAVDPQLVAQLGTVVDDPDLLLAHDARSRGSVRDEQETVAGGVGEKRPVVCLLQGASGRLHALDRPVAFLAVC